MDLRYVLTVEITLCILTSFQRKGRWNRGLQ